VVFKDALKEVQGGVIMSLEVSAGAKKTEFSGYNQWRKSISVEIKSPPKGGKANKELIKFLENTFKTNVEIVSGLTSPQKSVFIKKDLKSVVEILVNLIGK